jgi:hypothetical protein
VIIVKTAPASPTPATATKGDFRKDHITPKCDKQLQSNQPLKWKSTREKPSRSQVIKRQIELITLHTKTKPPPIQRDISTITKVKKKRTKPNTKEHTNQKRRTQANFATPKRKHSPQWLHILLRIKNTNAKIIERSNHTEPLSQRSINVTINNTVKPLQPNANPKTYANTSKHATSPPTRPIPLNYYPPGSNMDDAEDHPNQCALTHINLAAVSQKWLHPTTAKDIAPPSHTNLMCLPPTPGSTPLCKPTKRCPTTWFTMVDLVLNYLILNLHAAHYLPQTTRLVLPETNHQTQVRENTNHQLKPMAAEYSHPGIQSPTPTPHPKTNRRRLTWEGVGTEDDPEQDWEETEREDTPPLSSNKTEQYRCVSQKKSNSRMNASRILTQNM